MKIIRSIFIFFSLIVVAGYLFFALTYFPRKADARPCVALQVTIRDSLRLHFVSARDVAVLLDKNQLNPIGKSLPEINTSKIETLLKTNAAVKDVDCYKTPSGNLRITIFQREPIFRVMNENNFYVDTEGFKMPVSLHSSVPVIVVTGAVSDSLIERLHGFVLKLREDPFWNSQIEQIHVLPQQQIMLTPRVGSQQILLGTLSDCEEKLLKMKKLYQGGLTKMDWIKYEKFDLRYKNQVIGTKK